MAGSSTTHHTPHPYTEPTSRLGLNSATRSTFRHGRPSIEAVGKPSGQVIDDGFVEIEIVELELSDDLAHWET